MTHPWRSPSRRPRPSAQAQRGVSLIEALLAFLVLAFGVLSVSKLQQPLQAHADLARQRSDAVRIAQADIESLRAFMSLQAPPGAPPGHASYDDIADATSSIDALNGARLNTVYHLTRQVDADVSLRLKAATVSVGWTARDGSSQRAILATTIAGQSPALTGALSLGPSVRAVSGGLTRAPGIPPQAKNLGDGRSALKPGVAGTVAFVFDNVSAQATLRCTEVPSGKATAQLTIEDLTHCTEVQGLWLSGTVRFSLAMPPNPTAANDVPLDLAVSVEVRGAGRAVTPWCSAEPLKTVRYRAADGIHRDAVPLAAEPASVGVSDWTELGERFVSYQCLVPTSGSPARWSGPSVIVPMGWSIGSAPTARKVCRYTHDADGSGAIDRNDEHPAVYSGVDRPLGQQNFLVIRGDLGCPTDAAARIGVGTPTVVVQAATVQHQP